MHNTEQERWEHILGKVKQEGRKIKRRRAVAAFSATMLTALAVMLSVTLFHTRTSNDAELLMAQQAELEVLMISNDVIDENLGVF